ncbi:MAG TPA: hypothetical protein PKH69_02145 [Thiobacillaceae bacterium]|nr:hypothetical protein [Thiobacillaceae bacterium]HNU62887.1 hypothetical protein [Thiobacillaceae bacterium]
MTRHIINLLLSLAFLGGVLAHVPTAGAAGRSCESTVSIEAAADYRIAVPTVTQGLRELTPEFFGFNLEWVGFQTTFWEAATRRVNPAVVAYLQAFPGAVYRYPGGGGANSFQWADSVGQYAMRPKRKVVSWLNPVAVNFGFDEFLDFVHSVAGKPWVVLNLYGTRAGETQTEPLLESATAWVNYAKAKASAGADPVLRWELGNELDRGPTKSWSPAKYVSIAGTFGNAINAARPSGKPVAMLQDWKAQLSRTVSGYNQDVMSGLRDVTTEYAHHLYFDAPPASREVPRRFAVVCGTLANAKKIGIANPRIWITEFGRDIPHVYDNSAGWKNSWPKTANLEAALGVADAVILATQIPEIAGVFAHSLATTKGPWPMFHADQSGALRPSVVFQTLRLLREDMLPVVLETQLRSNNRSGYAGGYDLRATVMTNLQRDRFALWAVNRAPQAISVEVLIPQLAARVVEARHRYVADANLEANNYASAGSITVQEAKPTLAFDNSGTMHIVLPPQSVSSIGFAR